MSVPYSNGTFALWLQVAYLRLQQLLEAAERLGWTAEQRRERFRGAGGTPVVFILTPYRKQVFLCQQVLDSLHALPDSLSHCIVVRPPLRSCPSHPGLGRGPQRIGA